MHLRISNIDGNNIATGNAITHDQALALLSGPVSNPSDARFMADGIPRILEPLGAPDGYVAIAPVSYVVEGYCVRKTYTLESIADHEARGAAERAAAEAEAILAEQQRQLDKPAELRAIENLFLILCGAITLQPDLSQVQKLGFQVLPACLGQAQASPEYLAGVLAVIDGYAAVFAAMQITKPADLDGLKELAAFINSAGVYYNLKWWDDCVLHPELLGA